MPSIQSNDYVVAAPQPFVLRRANLNAKTQRIHFNTPLRGTQRVAKETKIKR